MHDDTSNEPLAELMQPTTGKSRTKRKELPDEIIRPELNIEKHADFIFIPAHSKKVREPRRREGWVTLPDGSREKSYLQISPIVGGRTPTTTTRKFYLVLQKLYEEKQDAGKLKPDGSMVVSTNEILEKAMLKLGGKNCIRAHEEMKVLRECMFEWVHTFVAPNGERYAPHYPHLKKVTVNQ